MLYWNALDIINQVNAENGQPKLVTIKVDDPLVTQVIAALNAAGNELLMFYTWEQFRREFLVDLVAGQDAYDLPPDWAYFLDQTQWDRTNHWPLLGPKSAAEWAWLKGGLLASFPRMRYRVMNNKFTVWPVPESNSQYHLAMEYMSGWWVGGSTGGGLPTGALVKEDGDVVMYDPWLMVKFTKLKWLQLKGMDSSAAAGDFQRVWEALKGKDTGAQVLSLVPQKTPFFIGPWSVPDGNWNV